MHSSKNAQYEIALKLFANLSHSALGYLLLGLFFLIVSLMFWDKNYVSVLNEEIYKIIIITTKIFFSIFCCEEHEIVVDNGGYLLCESLVNQINLFKE